MTSIILWVGLFALMAIGVPIAFSMGLISIFMLLAEGSVLPIVIAQKAFNGLDSFTLLAVPFFIIAANVMTETGVGDKIFDFAGSLVRHIPGGLGQVNIIASVIMAGMSGSAVSDVTGIGKLEIDAMERAGYDKPFSAAVTSASAALGPIIPPSISMVLYGSITNVSIGGLLIGGLLPGILMAIGMMVVVFIISKKRHYPLFPREKFPALLKNFWNCLPALLMPVILIGGMLGGLLTPTEAACTAVVYAILIGVLLYRNLSFKRLFAVLEQCVILMCSIMFIISCAAIFGLVLTQQQIPQRLAAFFISLSSNRIVLLILVNIMLLVLGCLMEQTSIFIVLSPILALLGQQMGMNPVHFGVMVVFNLNLALLTPPVGLVMFVTCKITKIKTLVFIKELLPFLAILVFTLVLVIFIPIISILLPGLLLGL